MLHVLARQAIIRHVRVTMSVLVRHVTATMPLVNATVTLTKFVPETRFVIILAAVNAQAVMSRVAAVAAAVVAAAAVAADRWLVVMMTLTSTTSYAEVLVTANFNKSTRVFRAGTFLS